jgi:predicted RNA-binding Zn-ribbon protein involved in translation (DUF1610 family)
MTKAESDKRYREKHREQIRIKKRLWSINNKQKKSEQDKRCYQKRKTKAEHKCPDCGKLIWLSSIRCNECDQFLKRGKLSPHWKGATVTQSGARARAKCVLNNQKFSCSICGRTDLPLEIHHKDRNPYNNNILNLIVVCRKCHHDLFHKYKPRKCRL